MLIKFFVLGLFVVSGLCPSASAHAQSPTPLIELCATCHGKQGEGSQAQAAPRIAGQSINYLQRQLLSFKLGKRGYGMEDQTGNRMRDVAARLNNDDIHALALYFNQLTLPKKAVKSNQNGKDLYTSTCMQCHGTKAQGYDQLQSPNLTILDGWYIAAQLEKYKNGSRGNVDGADLPTLWMRTMATHISSPTDVDDVIHYIGSLANNSPHE